MPAGNDSGNHLFLMCQTEKTGIFNHIGTMTCMTVVVDGDAYIMQHGSRFQQAAPGITEAVNWFPGIEHRERQSGDMLTMFYVCGIEQKNVARAFIENVFGDNWCFFFFRVVVKEKTFTNTAAGNDYFLTACCFQKTLDYTGTCQNEISTVGAETGYFPALFQSGFTQKFKGCSEGLRGELKVVDFRSRVLAFFLFNLFSVFK